MEAEESQDEGEDEEAESSSIEQELEGENSKQQTIIVQKHEPEAPVQTVDGVPAMVSQMGMEGASVLVKTVRTVTDFRTNTCLLYTSDAADE